MFRQKNLVGIQSYGNDRRYTDMNESQDTHDIDQLERKYGEEKPSVEFAALLEQDDTQRSYREVSVGERISGTIGILGDTTAFVDYGGRSEAAIDIQELRNEMGELIYNTGDTIQAFVAATEGEVRLTLSLRASNRQVLRQAFENGIPIEGRVTGFNTGGLVVNIGGLRAFCPLSQVEAGYCDNPESYAGQTHTFKILELRGRGRNIVVSRRAHLEAEAQRRAKELRDKLSEGTEMDGKVTRVERFGAFVDLGGVEGLVHVSEISHQRVENPRDVLSAGDQVRVKILELKGLGGDKERISLSLKALQPDPWDEASERLHEGEVITGKVVSLQSFGAFVELIPGVEGLVHISQLSAERRINKPGEVISVGQEVQVRIQGIDREQKRISLSMKAAQQDAAQTAEAQEIEDFRTKQQDKAADEGSSMADALRRAGLL